MAYTLTAQELNEFRNLKTSVEGTGGTVVGYQGQYWRIYDFLAQAQ